MFEWESYFESHILERGWRYARAGAVKHLLRKGDEIEAVVSGSEYYKVSMKYDGHRISELYCSCPYAADGNLCKHMAAVLYEADQAEEEDGRVSAVSEKYEIEEDDKCFADSENPELSFGNFEARPIAEIVREADRSKLEKILLDLAYWDDKVEAHIRSALSGTGSLVDINELKKEVDSIICSYIGREGYIDYYNVSEFMMDLDNYLLGTADRLLDEGCYSAAFDLSVYALIKVNECDMDDDGHIQAISNTCYSIWQRIITACSPEEKEQIKKWFVQYSEDGAVNDYMEGVLQDFLRYELASEEELREEIEELDLLIEESRGACECRTVYSEHYGYGIEAIQLRIILMKKLGIEEKEIDEFRRGHMYFRSIRKYFLGKARETGDVEEEIRLLIQSKSLDADSSYLLHLYSERLIDLYKMRNEYGMEKAERREDFLSNQRATMEDFREYRKMCSEEEWKKERTYLIETRESIDRRCEFLAEEKMLTELYELISGQDDKLPYLNKYGFLLSGSYGGQILAVYRDYVSEFAVSARSRSSYDQLVRYLKRMREYTGGYEIVYSLCRDWIEKYPTRKVMVQELRKLM